MATKRPGLLISIDGIDSSGKETQVKHLVDRLRFQGFKINTFTTPDYNTKSGQELKKRLQNKIGDWEKTPWQEKLGYFADNRMEHKKEVIEALAKGEIVIYDRYIPSSLAFMAIEAQTEDATIERDVVHQTVKEQEYEKNQMPRENASIFLDVDYKIAVSLLEKRKEKLQDEDEYTDHVEVQQKLYSEYDQLYSGEPEHYIRIKCTDGEKLLGITDIAELVWTALLKKFPHLAEKQ